MENLKREISKYTDENDRLKRENESNQQEINDFDSQLQNFGEIEEQIKNAESKLQGLKENKEPVQA